MLFAIWYYLCNLKNVKNTHGGKLFLVKFQASGFMGVFHVSLNCTNEAKSCKTPHISYMLASPKKKIPKLIRPY